MDKYDKLLDVLDNIVMDRGEGPELRNGVVADLYSVRMGKFYNEQESFVVTKRAAKSLRGLADKLDELVSQEALQFCKSHCVSQ